MTGSRVTNNQLLDQMFELTKGQGELNQHITNVESKLDKHLEECNLNGHRSKDERGKYVNRRKSKWKDRILIFIAVVSLLGGWSALKFAWDKVDNVVQDYEQHKQSDLE